MRATASATSSAYTDRKRAQHVLDYDDLLLFWKALATSDHRTQLAEMFDHVLVDEYQDTNALQADILAGLRPEDTPRNLTVVGDDAQAIYGFRAATVRNILEFPARFPGATVVRLEQNYRSTPPVLDSSNAVIALSPQRHEKTLWSARRGTAAPTLRTCSTRPSNATLSARPCSPTARKACRRGAGGPVPRRAPQRPPRGRAHVATSRS